MDQSTQTNTEQPKDNLILIVLDEDKNYDPMDRTCPTCGDELNIYDSCMNKMCGQKEA
jgi:hypothetical protein